MRRPATPELRQYLLELVREERSLERLYRESHSSDELTAIRAEWKAAYRRIRELLLIEDARLQGGSPADPKRAAGASVRVSILPSKLTCF